jgi:hypothetical protein
VAVAANWHVMGGRDTAALTSVADHGMYEATVSLVDVDGYSSHLRPMPTNEKNDVGRRKSSR